MLDVIYTREETLMYVKYLLYVQSMFVLCKTKESVPLSLVSLLYCREVELPPSLDTILFTLY